MKTKKIFAVLVFVMGFLFLTEAQTVTKKSTAIDYEALAQKLVNQCGNIHEGEIVLVSGGVNDLELLENIKLKNCVYFPGVTVATHC